MSFDFSKYETVKERKKRFYQDYPDGRIVVEILNLDYILEYALIKASIFLTNGDQQSGLAKSSGYALEIRDMETKKSNSGKIYESVNFSSWCENCEESAIGRALDNAGYAGNDKCSREEMEKVERVHEQQLKAEQLTTEFNEKLEALPEEIKNGFRVLFYTRGQVRETCEKHKWDNAEILSEINQTVDLKEAKK
jgi:hypothetical protein